MRKLIGLSLIVASISPTAWGYIDPGAGSFVLQMIIAGIAGLGVTLRMYWNRLRGKG